MKKIIYLTVCSVVLFSCSIQGIEPIKTINNTNISKPLQTPVLTLKNQDSVYLGSIFKLNADLKDENGNTSNDVIWKSSDEKIGKIEKDIFLYALSVGKITITATSSKYPTISKSFELTIKEKTIKTITVKSKKDGYVIAKTGDTKKQFNFDRTVESQDTFIGEIEYEDGTKSEQLVWESNDKNIIYVENGIIKGINYGSVDINVYNPDNKSSEVIFRANFLDTLLISKKNECTDKITVDKYNNFNDSGLLVDLSEVKEKVNFTGKIYDNLGVPIVDAIVNAKSVDPYICWVGEEQKTQSGAYLFKNAPAGMRVEITVKKDRWKTSTRTEMLKSNFNGETKVNIFDFGRGNDLNGTDPNNLYAMKVL